MNNKVGTLLDSVTVTGAGPSKRLRSRQFTVQADGSVSAATGSAIVDVEVSNNGQDWEVAGTINLSLVVGQVSDGFAVNAPWGWIRGNVTTITGTDAEVSLIMGISRP